MLRSFGYGWIFACAIAGAIVGALEEGGLQFFATLVLTGFLVGVAQALVLLRWDGTLRPNFLIRWTSTSGLGWLAGTWLSIELASVLTLLINWLNSLGGWEVLWINVIKQPVILLGFGTAQWLMLRRRYFHPHRWIIISVLAGVIKGAVSSTVCAMVCPAIARQTLPVLAGAIANGSGWAAYGLITGIVLLQLRQPQLEP